MSESDMHEQNSTAVGLKQGLVQGSAGWPRHCCWLFEERTMMALIVSTLIHGGGG